MGGISCFVAQTYRSKTNSFTFPAPRRAGWTGTLHPLCGLWDLGTTSVHAKPPPEPFKYIRWRKAYTTYPSSPFPSFLASRPTSAPAPNTAPRLSHNDPAMQIFYVFYFTLVTYLLATTMPESQGRWLALSRNIVSLISYAHSTTPVSVDTCWPSSFGIDDTCHPLDLFITPTPTVISSTPATRTVSAVAASPIGFNTVSYRDVFAERFDIARAPRNRKNSKPTQRGTLCGVELAHLLDLLTTVTSTMIIVQLFTVRKSTPDSSQAEACTPLAGSRPTRSKISRIAKSDRFHPQRPRVPPSHRSSRLPLHFDLLLDLHRVIAHSRRFDRIRSQQ